MIALSSNATLLFGTVFIGAVVEAVEALTIILAIGLTRDWRSTWLGAAAATVILAAGVVLGGPALRNIPIGTLHLVIGSLVLVFGLQWVKKAILRASGYMPIHDEDKVYQKAAAAAKQTKLPTARDIDWYGFTIVFKAVLLEGLEIVFIVLGFGSSWHNLPVAIAGGIAGVVAVAAAGTLIHRPLSKVPENTMKGIVGIMLTSFGLFWAGSGAGLHWPAGNATLIGLILFNLAVTLSLIAYFKCTKFSPMAAAS